MSEKKQASNAWIAAGHFARAGFLFPLLFGLILGVPAVFLLIPFTSPEIAAIVISIILLGAIWAGVIFSAKRIAKKYDVKEADKIVNWSALYYVVFSILERSNDVLKPGGMTAVVIIYTACVAVGFIIFYFLSKKYVRNSEEAGM